MKTYNSRFLNWRVDEDGLLRVTARVLADGVFPYLADESPEGARPGADGLVGHYIPEAEFTEEALHSLEGKPVIVGEHEWRNSENAMHDGLTVGAVAGTPEVRDGYIVCDFIISDKDAVERVMRGELVEVSAAYDAACEAKDGMYQGKPFGAVQSGLRFNHVLLLRDGEARCSPGTRIVNKSQKENLSMGKIIQRQFGNSRVDFRFENEADAAEAEKMADEERKFNASELEAAMSKAAEVKAQMDSLKAEYDEAMKTIEAQKKQIDDLMSAETQEALAAEAAAQTEAEDAILDEAVENEVIAEEEKEVVKNQCKNCKTFADRRRVVVQNAMKLDAEALRNWNQDAVDGAFETLNRQASIRSERANRKMNKSPMGGARGKVNNSQSTLERILRPIRLQNARQDGKE